MDIASHAGLSTPTPRRTNRTASTQREVMPTHEMLNLAQRRHPWHMPEVAEEHTGKMEYSAGASEAQERRRHYRHERQNTQSEGGLMRHCQHADVSQQPGPPAHETEQARVVHVHVHSDRTSVRLA